MSAETEAADEAPAERVWPFVLKLKVPVEFAGERVASLEFRRGRMGDMKGIKLKGEIAADDLMRIAARLCGKATDVIELLADDDCGEVNAIAMGFYVRFLTTGNKR